MTTAEMQMRILQMYGMLRNAMDGSLPRDYQETVEHTDGTVENVVRFSGAAWERQSRAEHLIAAIAELRDPLKKWSSAHGKTFDYKEMLRANPAAALVQDLCNAKKHGGIDPDDPRNPPWTGHAPKLVNVWQGYQNSTTTEPIIMTTTESGETTFEVGEGWELVVTAEVIDEVTGDQLGDFGAICAEAIEQWEAVLLRLGFEIPKGT